MGKHLRKLFSVNEVKKVFERYLSRKSQLNTPWQCLRSEGVSFSNC